MSLNETVSAERVHIAFFGRRNAGKSSLVNAVTGQSLSVVSPVKGTTTDPVRKAMELLPLGPVLIIDTPGWDDEGELGQLRIQKTNEILAKTDIAVLVLDGSLGMTEEDRRLLEALQSRKLPVILVQNKADLEADRVEGALRVSAVTGEGVNALKERLAELGRSVKTERSILGGLVHAGDTVILVIPIDESAPKGRLILPQQQTLREGLDRHCSVICCQVEELSGVLANLKTPPRLVITESQAFGRVSKLVPEEIDMTSFSILFARYKGELETLVRGAEALRDLRDGDKVLISEGCTHHRQCGDIGTVKLPAWIGQYTGCPPSFSFTSGGDFPADLAQYRLVIHCGGCMLNEKEMHHRMALAEAAGVPMVNYGVAIACIHGILDRSLAPLLRDL